MSDAVKNQENIGKLWTAIEKLKGVVLGNGTEGHEQRITELEKRTLPANCIGKQALEAYVKKLELEAERKKSWRIGDIANYIQLAVLVIIFIQLLVVLK